ncbi:transposase [Devosia marina]|jgi:transposase|uniref:transposase n=1 Tax=Devosia marina TaxID=2683198 RepID=UPI000D5C4F2F
MGKGNFSDAFKRDAVRQITERGYPVSEVSQRLGGAPTRSTRGARRTHLMSARAMNSPRRPGS